MTETKCGKCRAYICDCTCTDTTGYSKKRRLLREHRKTMRAMEAVIFRNDLHREYGETLRAGPAQDWDVGSDLDETSDVEDPEKKAKDDLEGYKQEMTEKETLFQMAVVETARGSVEDRQLRLDLERARMEMEDLRGQMLRAK